MVKVINPLTFVYGNGKCGHAIIVPQAKSQISFMEYARKFKWVESMLEHVAGQDCDTEDASGCLCFYLRKRHDASFSLRLGVTWLSVGKTND